MFLIFVFLLFFGCPLIEAMEGDSIVNYLKSVDVKKTPTAEITEKFNNILPALYKEHLNQSSYVLFSDLPGMEYEKREIEKHEESQVKLGTVIYNQQGYTQNELPKDIAITDLPEEGGIIKKGNPLELKNFEFQWRDKWGRDQSFKGDVPIGYNIHLPECDPKDIKGVIVHVYGGGGGYYKPLNLTNIHNYLLKNNIAVVTLNLVDHLELTSDQAYMQEDLYAKLHASIDCFFKTLRGNDSKIMFSGLTIPRTAKIILYGASFGGMRAIRHAELYPNTFDGYISHDGGISPTIVKKQSFQETGNTTENWLSPMEEPLKLNKLAGKVSKTLKDPKVLLIQDPILLLHNYDDNNVPLKATLDFYQEALNCGKKHLVQLYITRRGNPLPQDYFATNKGHYATGDKEAFPSYAATITSFFLEGPSTLSSEWMAHQWEIYANKNYQAATEEEKFISEAYRLYKTPYSRASLQENIAQEGELFNYMTDVTSKWKFPFKEDKGAQEEVRKRQLRKEDEKFNQFWENKGRPLYYMMKYLNSLKAVESELSSLNKGETLKNEKFVRNTIQLQLPVFLDYIREKLSLNLPYDMDLGFLAKNPELQKQFQFLLEQPASGSFDVASLINFKKHLLQTLYMANPELMKERVYQLIQENTISPQVIKGEDEAKDNLYKRIKADKEFTIEELKKMGPLHIYDKKRVNYELYMKGRFEDFKKIIKNYEDTRENDLSIGRLAGPEFVDMLNLIRPIFGDDNPIALEFRSKIIKYYENVIQSFSPNIKEDPTGDYILPLLSLAIIKGDKDIMSDALEKSGRLLPDEEKIETPWFMDYVRNDLLPAFHISKLTYAEIEAIWKTLGDKTD